MKEIINWLFNLIKGISIVKCINLLILTILLIPNTAALANSYKWNEVPSSQYGRQWWEENTLVKNDDGSIKVISKYRPKQTKREIYYLYTMDINCKKNLYRDLTVNGKDIPTIKWNTPNGDILIQGVINQACSLQT
tara:strand:- start:325 stop:732 length:408 start_codon:yes stop_codon:yes gene_type:complete